MEKYTFVLVLSLFLFHLLRGSHGQIEATQDATHHPKPPKLYVFGDSYADTGNNNKLSESWNVPYGITTPGKPAGRFSDGLILTDYIARFFGLNKTPIAYQLRRGKENVWRHGMNFAWGGTGVFETVYKGPNMTTQISYFQDHINDFAYAKEHLNSSLALVTLSGNDYYTFNVATNGTGKGIEVFIQRVVNQLAVNLKLIGDLGVRKVMVASIQTLGCLPERTADTLFKICNKTDNRLAQAHNLFLSQAVTKLNNETNGSPYVMLDLYSSFLDALQNKGATVFENPYKPCCMGTNSNFECGDVDQKGNKMYTVCSNPHKTFFWDKFHPTQMGWRAVVLNLIPTLHSVLFS